MQIQKPQRRISPTIHVASQSAPGSQSAPAGRPASQPAGKQRASFALLLSLRGALATRIRTSQFVRNDPSRTNWPTPCTYTQRPSRPQPAETPSMSLIRVPSLSFVSAFVPRLSWQAIFLNETNGARNNGFCSPHLLNRERHRIDCRTLHFLEIDPDAVAPDSFQDGC